MKIAPQNRQRACQRGRAAQIALDSPATAGQVPADFLQGTESMKQAAVAPVIEYLARSRDVVQAAIDDPVFTRTIVAIVDRVAAALGAGGKLLLVGNGGSAADAQHLAGEMIGRLNYDRAPAAAIALTTDTSALTAIGNDYGYERIFERQVLGLGRAGDVLIALSTSGRSPNILRAIAAAREIGIATIGFTGKTGGDMAAQCDLCLLAPSESTPLIQQIHITAGHVICGLVEERLFPRTDTSRPQAAAAS
jgi:D-sedoheptulose 7-phosphate isomerase